MYSPKTAEMDIMQTLHNSSSLQFGNGNVTRKPRLGGVKFGISRQRLSELSLMRNIMGTTSL